MKQEQYQARIKKVLEYIDCHIDETLTVTQLCEAAHFSPYHFHRLFSAFMGMPLIKYIQYIKLKRAAYQLSMQKTRKIIDIAFDAGFESHEAFSRAFKKACGVSPTQFRDHPDWESWRVTPYKYVQHSAVTVTIKEFPATRTAAVKHRGDYALVHKTAEKLIAWCERNGIFLKEGECYGIVYNDPESTPTDEFRFDFCQAIEDKIVLNDSDVEEYVIKGGRYAVARHRGSHDTLGDILRMLYRDWLPNSGEELRDAPCFFQYYNFAHDVQETGLITDVYLPLE